MAPSPAVLVLTTTFPASAGDGTPEFVLTLAQSIDDVRITVVTPRVAGAPRREVMDGVHVERVAYFPRRFERLADDAIMPAIRARPLLALQAPFLIVALTVGTWRAQRRIRPVVINAHWIVPAGLIARLLRALGGPPYLVTVHGADAYALRGSMARRIKHVVLRGAAAVLPVSGDIIRALDLPPDTPVRRMGVDGSVVRDAMGERDPEDNRFLFIGRLAEKKGVDVLLDALAEVPGAHLDIIGDGPDAGDLRSRARQRGLDERVSFLGRRPKRDVYRAMASATAVVIPSRIAADGDMEGTPVVLAEAMSAGVPVIASDLAGMAECIVDGESGLLVPPNDVPALAAALSDVVGGVVDLEAMSAASIVAAARELDIRTVGRQYRQAIAAAIT